MSKRPIVALLAASLLMASGCANNKIANTTLIEQQARDAATKTQMSPEEAVLEAAVQLNKATAEQLHFYAPLHIASAQDSLKDAQSLLRKGKPSINVIEEAFKVSQLITDARKTKETVKTTLAKVLEHKAVLDELGVQQEQPKAYQAALNDIQDLIKEVEGGYIDKAIAGQADVLLSLTDVEVDTLKMRHLAPVEALMDKADDIDADEFAEATYAHAEKTLETSIQFIEQNYRDRQGVKQAGKEALRAAQHSFYVAKESALIVELDPERAEQRVLFVEELLERINLSLQQESVIGMSLRDQSATLATRVEALRKQSIVTESPKQPAIDAVAESSVETTPVETPLADTPLAETTPVKTKAPVSAAAPSIKVADAAETNAETPSAEIKATPAAASVAETEAAEIGIETPSKKIKGS